MNKDKTKDQLAQHILQKNHKDRNLFDVRWLQKELSNNNFFKKFIDQGDFIVIHQCFKELGYTYANKGETIIRYGDIGKTFYIIIRGAVDVYVPIETKVTLSYLEFTKLCNEYRDMILVVNGDENFQIPPVPTSALEIYNEIKLDDICMKLDGVNNYRRGSVFLNVCCCYILNLTFILYIGPSQACKKANS